MLNRRDFIKNTAIVSAGSFIAPDLFAFNGSPNEKVVIGLM